MTSSFTGLHLVRFEHERWRDGVDLPPPRQVRWAGGWTVKRCYDCDILSTVESGAFHCILEIHSRTVMMRMSLDENSPLLVLGSRDASHSSSCDGGQQLQCRDDDNDDHADNVVEERKNKKMFLWTILALSSAGKYHLPCELWRQAFSQIAVLWCAFHTKFAIHPLQMMHNSFQQSRFLLDGSVSIHNDILRWSEHHPCSKFCPHSRE